MDEGNKNEEREWNKNKQINIIEEKGRKRPVVRKLCPARNCV
jgi:ribosomal protein S14